MILFMSNILLRFNKKDIIAERNTTFYKVFKKKIRGHLKEIIPQVPDIGNSIFKSSYLIGVAFIAWYKAFLEMGLSSDEANIWIWKGTENAIKKIPRFMIPLVKKIYLGGMLRKAEEQTEKSKKGTLPEYDWSINYVKVGRNKFRLDTYECGLKKLCKKFGVEEMLPSLCRMDYLTAHYLKYSFERTKTLGDGNEVCNNQFSFIGECAWAPEKGFEHRK